MPLQEAVCDVVRLHVGVLDVQSDGTLDGKQVVKINGKAVGWEHVRIILTRGQRPRVVVSLDPRGK